MWIYGDYMKKVNYNLVGEKIRSRRREFGLSQEQLAEACHISTSYLGHIERGSRKLAMETAVKIAENLRMSLDYLLLDAISLEPGILTNLEPLLREKSPVQVKKFLNTVKILATHIEEM